ncbi:MAG: hypothetical protein HY420_02845 [Candidatus Kerfeldbacteria bacterium]|nr:hypothetical protein [Candidatus Kerfeldbacteria bacterium]
MLVQLLSSRTRVKLLKLFFLNQDRAYFVREMVRKTGEHLNSVRREVKNLHRIGFVREINQGKKKFYQVNTEHGLFPEFKALLFKAQVLEQRKTLRELQRIGRIKYLCLTGFFSGLEHTVTDVLIVGSINRLKLKKLLRRFQLDFDRPLNYTVMTPSEFRYRNDLTDRFLYTILENPKIVIVDKLHQRQTLPRLTGESA